jgi:hypothetical protein
MQVVRTALSAREWCCLWDAVQGGCIAPTQRELGLWATRRDGAIAHSRAVIGSLSRRGLLRKTAAGVYVATQLSAAALLLPIADNASLEPLAASTAALWGQWLGLR